MIALLSALVPLGAGIASALQAATNGGLTLRTSLVTALLVNVAGTLLGAATLLALPGSRAMLPAADTPWYLYLGGLYGLVIIAGLAFAFPRLGGAWSIALFVLGQSATALVLDHFALIGQSRDPLSATRAAGLALVVGGVLLLRR
jgi:bacterial/archaeal transporter family-2 protein